MSIRQFQQAAVLENPATTFQLSCATMCRSATQVLMKFQSSGIVQASGETSFPLCDCTPPLIKASCIYSYSEVRAVLGWGVYNSIIGHEGVGTVIKAGPDVSPGLVGQRVGFKWLYNACTECSVCRRGFFQNCPKQLNTSRHVPGTLQQYAVADTRFITRISNGVPDKIAAPLLCAGLTMAGALAHLDHELQPGDWVVISGSGGGLGHIGVQLAARARKLRVIAVDSGDEKRDLSLSSGAEAFFDFKSDDVGKRVLELTGEGAHATIVVPGTKEAFHMAPTLVRNMGHIICVGLPRNDIELPISATLCAARRPDDQGIIGGI